MDDRGVSPVIGIILMVAIVTILGAIIGAYALGFAGQLGGDPPEVGFTYDWDSGTRTLDITHSAGTTIDVENTERLEVVVRDDDGTGSNDYGVARTDWANDSNGGFPIQSGDTFTVTGENGGGDLDVEVTGTDVANPGSEVHEPEVGDRVELVWTAADGSRSAIVGRYTIPAGEDP